MGLGDMLIKLGIRYGSSNSVNICDKIGKTLADTAIYASALLAKEEGPFPNYDEDEITKSQYFIYNTSFHPCYICNKGATFKKMLILFNPLHKNMGIQCKDYYIGLTDYSFIELC